MLKNPKCKYCNEVMEIENTDYYGTSYKCNCENYRKEQKIKDEIYALKQTLGKKERELENLINNSMYERTLREYESRIKAFKDQFKDI